MAFVTVLASAFIFKAASMTLWEESLEVRIARPPVDWRIGTFATVDTRVFSDNWLWLIFVQALSGILWSAYELAFFLMFLDYIRSDAALTCFPIIIWQTRLPIAAEPSQEAGGLPTMGRTLPLIMAYF